MRPGDLQPMRLQVVDERLAEAAFLAQLLLGREAGGGRGHFFIVIRCLRPFVAPVLGFPGCGGTPAPHGPAFAATLVQREFSLIAARLAAAGAAPVVLRGNAKPA